jgi:predicted 3-demethylubiquinone-9 3-methyltransferase (glyoxalase superfamily)
MPSSVRPFLMFGGKAEEAMNFYISLIAGSEIVELSRHPPGGQGTEGSVLRAIFSVAGQTVLCTDSAEQHDFGFTPAFSFFVECVSDAEISELSAALAQGGSSFMPLKNYGFSQKFAWVQDRYGVSWQLNFA